MLCLVSTSLLDTTEQALKFVKVKPKHAAKLWFRGYSRRSVPSASGNALATLLQHHVVRFLFTLLSTHPEELSRIRELGYLDQLMGPAFFMPSPSLGEARPSTKERLLEAVHNLQDAAVDTSWDISDPSEPTMKDDSTTPDTAPKQEVIEVVNLSDNSSAKADPAATDSEGVDGSANTEALQRAGKDTTVDISDPKSPTGFKSPLSDLYPINARVTCCDSGMY